MAKKKMNEQLRKLIVSAKRKPHRIGLLAFLFSFVYYSLNLTCISNTTAKIQGPGMGLCGFVTMLFSMLALVSYMNSFPHRKKVNVPMLIIMFLMVAAVIYSDIHYRSLIYAAVFRADNPIQVTANTAYIAKAASMLSNHIVMLVVSAVLTALSPVFGKLLKKIDTSVDIDSYSSMAAIDIQE